LKGSGTVVRHITIRQVEDLDPASVKRLIKDAVANVKERGHFKAVKGIVPKTIVMKGSAKKRRPASY
jgi:hypothetical protein